VLLSLTRIPSGCRGMADRGSDAERLPKRVARLRHASLCRVYDESMTQRILAVAVLSSLIWTAPLLAQASKSFWEKVKDVLGKA
jgi:hypothetical protein